MRVLTSVRCGNVDDVADRRPGLPVKAMQDKLLDSPIVRWTGIKCDSRQQTGHMKILHVELTGSKGCPADHESVEAPRSDRPGRPKAIIMAPDRVRILYRKSKPIRQLTG